MKGAFFDWNAGGNWVQLGWEQIEMKGQKSKIIRKNVNEQFKENPSQTFQQNSQLKVSTGELVLNH